MAILSVRIFAAIVDLLSCMLVLVLYIYILYRLLNNNIEEIHPHSSFHIVTNPLMVSEHRLPPGVQQCAVNRFERNAPSSPSIFQRHDQGKSHSELWIEKQN